MCTASVPVQNLSAFTEPQCMCTASVPLQSRKIISIESGMFVSCTHWPPLTLPPHPEKYIWYPFLLEIESTTCTYPVERILSMEKFNDNIGNRTRYLPACSAVPRPIVRMLVQVFKHCQPILLLVPVFKHCQPILLLIPVFKHCQPILLLVPVFKHWQPILLLVPVFKHCQPILLLVPVCKHCQPISLSYCL